MRNPTMMCSSLSTCYLTIAFRVLDQGTLIWDDLVLMGRPMGDDPYKKNLGWSEPSIPPISSTRQYYAERSDEDLPDLVEKSYLLQED